MAYRILKDYAYRHGLVDRSTESAHARLSDVEVHMMKMERTMSAVCHMLSLESVNDLMDAVSNDRTSVQKKMDSVAANTNGTSSSEVSDKLVLSVPMLDANVYDEVVSEEPNPTPNFDVASIEEAGSSIVADLSANSGPAISQKDSNASSALNKSDLPCSDDDDNISFSKATNAVYSTISPTVPSLPTTKCFSISWSYTMNFPSHIPLKHGESFRTNDSQKVFTIIGYMLTRPVKNILCCEKHLFDAATEVNPVTIDDIQFFKQTSVMQYLKRDPTDLYMRNIFRYGPGLQICAADMTKVFTTMVEGQNRKVKLQDIACRGAKRIKLISVDDKPPIVFGVSPTSWSQLT